LKSFKGDRDLAFRRRGKVPNGEKVIDLPADAGSAAKEIKAASVGAITKVWPSTPGLIALRISRSSFPQAARRSVRATKNNFKPVVRMFKNMRNTMIEKKLLADGVAPSYFIEDMLWNVPTDKFAGDYGDIFVACYNWVINADATKPARMISTGYSNSSAGQFERVLARSQLQHLHGRTQKVLGDLIGIATVQGASTAPLSDAACRAKPNGSSATGPEVDRQLDGRPAALEGLHSSAVKALPRAESRGASRP
jgi:hypothetical protein